MLRSDRNRAWLLVLGGAVFALLSGWRMMELPLWNHWPLGLFGGLWFITYGLLLQRYRENPLLRRSLHLAALTGALLGLAFLPLPFTGLIFFAWIPLFYAWDEILEHASSRPIRKVLLLSMFSFLGWNIWSTYWVANTALVPAVVAFVLNSFFMTWPILLYLVLRKRISPNLRWACLVSCWLAFEYLHLRWEMTWPWLTLGNAFAKTPEWIQWYTLTGVPGGSLWIWLVNIYWYEAWRKYRESSSPVWLVSIRPALWLVLPLVVSYILFAQYEPSGDPVQVSVIQPNYEPHYQKFNTSSKEQLKRYLAMADTAVTEETDYLILPETVFSSVRLSNVTENRYVSSFKRYLDSFPELTIVMGLSTYSIVDRPEETDQRALRTSVRASGDTLYWKAQNSVIEWERDEVEKYFKSKLVPGPEHFPYSDWLIFLKPVVDQLGGTVAGLEIQEEREVFSSDGRQVAPVICYESIFGEYCGGYVRRGAEAFFIITNDGWWDNTPGHIQHKQYAALRAIEYRRDVVRAANTGVSCFIDQRGLIRKPTQYEETTVLRGELLFRGGTTFYARWGDMISRLCIFGIIVFILNALSNRLMGTSFETGKPAKEN